LSSMEELLTRLSPEEKRELLAELLKKKAAADRAGDPLSDGQQALWQFHRLAPESSAYHLVATASLRGAVDVRRLLDAVGRLIDRHPQLRAVFPQHEGKPCRRTTNRNEAAVVYVDAEAWTESQRAARLAESSDRPFDLESGPLCRATVLRFGPRRFVVHVCVHHIVSDFWSLMQMMYEIGLDYRAADLGLASMVESPRADFNDYVTQEAELLAGPEGEQLRDYWRRRLEGADVSSALPHDFARPATAAHEGAGFNIALTAELSEKLRRLAEQESTTPYVVCLTAFCALLHRWTDRDDLLIGTPVHGRTPNEWRNVVGYFSNVAVVRSQRGAGATFRDMLRAKRSDVQDAIAHARYPFSRLVDDLAAGRSGERRNPIEALFAWEKAQRMPGLKHRRTDDAKSISAIEGVDLEFAVNAEQRGAPFELTLQVHDDGQMLDMRWQYACRLFRESTVVHLAEQFRDLLAAIAADPDLNVIEQPTASAAERARLDAWNATQVDYPLDVRLHDLIARQVAHRPDAPAVLFRDEMLTYGELERLAEQIAARLRSCGVGPDVVVGVYMHRSVELVAALYGILKAGGAYLPLSPEDPWDRAAFQLQDAGVTVVVTQKQFVDDVARSELRVIAADDMDAAAPSINDSPHESVAPPRDAAPCTPRHLAYVIYTSGSTGRPKGVMTEHRAIVNRILWMQDEYRLTPDDCVLQKTPYTFDVSVWEFFWPLAVGAKLAVAEPGGHRDAAYLVQTLGRYRVTTTHFVPTMLRAFLQQPGIERLTDLRRVFASGEALMPDLVGAFFRRSAADLHNLYGPTEAAVDVTYYACRRDETPAAIPIGRPIANVEILILDERMQPPPVGMCGELYIGGVAPARGYCDRPELTGERFVPHPQKPGERLYRTGDTARWTAEGVVEYRGRRDGQVKLGGNRIELGEIEAALLAWPDVREAAATVREDTTGAKLIAAYVVSHAGASIDVESLRAALEARLPSYMIPAAITTLDALPQTSSGKVDRNALPAPTSLVNASSAPYVAPRTADERALAAIFAEVLQLDRIGVDDNFFDLGGASSQAVEIIGRAAAMGYALSPDLLFRVPTIAGVAEACRLPTPISGNIVVESLGVYLPERTMTSEEVMQGCVRPLTLPLGRLTGIRTRRVAGDTEFAWDLSVRAVEECLRRSRAAADDVDAVICCNISRYDAADYGFCLEPSTAARLCAHFGLTDAEAFDVSNACAGMFTGISIAEGFLRAGIYRRVLVVSGEYISHLAETAQRTIEGDFDSRLPCLTLGDCGAAVLLEGSSGVEAGFHELDLCTLSQFSELCIAKSGEAGPIMLTDMLGVSSVITKQGLDHWIQTAVRKKWSLADIRHVIPHQVSQTTIVSGFNEMRKRTGVDVPTDVVISNVAERGNTATTSHWLAVWDHARSGRIKSGDTVLFGISGSGITVGTGLYKFDDLPDRLRAEPATRPTTSNAARPVARRRLDPRLRRAAVRGVGTARPTADKATANDSSAIGMAADAVRQCLQAAGSTGSEVGLMLYAGVYRDDYLCEPAVAALLADRLKLHAPDSRGEAGDAFPPFFAFDLANGALGFLQALHVAAHGVQSGRTEAALVTTAEVEPHAQHRIGLEPAGGAMLIGPSDGDARGNRDGRGDGTAGFGDFVFRSDWRHVADRRADLKRIAGSATFDAYVEVKTGVEFQARCVDLLVATMEELLDRERLEWDRVRAVLPPQISPEFLQLLRDRLPPLRDKLIAVPDAAADLFTSSVPFGWQALLGQGDFAPGDVVLVTAVGAGLQAGCASYYF